MGMFDFVKFEDKDIFKHPCEDKLEFQTKDFDRCFDTYIIQTDKKFVVDPNKHYVFKHFGNGILTGKRPAKKRWLKKITCTFKCHTSISQNIGSGWFEIEVEIVEGYFKGFKVIKDEFEYDVNEIKRIRLIKMLGE